MNIFYLSRDPHEAARRQCDRHVVKMILETAQLLSTAHNELDGEQVAYKSTHKNHPSAVWARSSSQHYNWLYSLFRELGREYTHRYGKDHSTIELLKDLLSHPPVNLKDNGWQEPPPAMSHYPQCIVPGDSIQSYKNYYNEAKAYFAKWTNRQQPEWFEGSTT